MDTATEPTTYRDTRRVERTERRAAARKLHPGASNRLADRIALTRAEKPTQRVQRGKPRKGEANE